MKYPNVNTRATISDVPCGPGWEGYRGTIVQDERTLQTVAYLALDFAKIFAPMMCQEQHAALHGEEDNQKFRNWTPEQIASKCCDLATTFYMEFESRDWFIATPLPVKVATSDAAE